MATDIGFVLEVKGDWVLEGRGDAPITPGDSLPANAVVSQTAKSDGENQLLVSLCTGEVLTIKDDRFELPKRVDPERVSRVWTLASKRYHSELISAQSRGGEDNSKLSDSVVRYQDGKLHLDAAFSKMPPGFYRLRLEPILGPAAAEAAEPILLDSYEWSPSTKPTLKVASVPRGVYEIYALEDGSSNPESSAVVLICPSQDYDQIAKDFYAATELVSTWGESTSRTTTRRFLRATLASLDDGEFQSGPSK